MWLDHDWKKARSYAANVTLDPDTAYFELFVSEDHRSVKRKNTRQDLPEKPGRFFLDPCVLGHEAFSSGRHYWEVEVGDRAYWELGVCEENIQRTWGITESPQNGFWAVELYADKYQALTSPRTLLPLSEPPRRVGIFLDYEAGDVSFYSVSDRSHNLHFPPGLSSLGLSGPFFCLWGLSPNPSNHWPLKAEKGREALQLRGGGDGDGGDDGGGRWEDRNLICRKDRVPREGKTMVERRCQSWLYLGSYSVLQPEKEKGGRGRKDIK
nr:butyrophilin subfamily 1 member A1-like [Loxodonta africana]